MNNFAENTTKNYTTDDENSSKEALLQQRIQRKETAKSATYTAKNTAGQLRTNRDKTSRFCEGFPAHQVLLHSRWIF